LSIENGHNIWIKVEVMPHSFNRRMTAKSSRRKTRPECLGVDGLENYQEKKEVAEDEMD